MRGWFLALAIILAQPAAAQNVDQGVGTGNGYKLWCNDPPRNSAIAGYCSGFIRGLTDLLYFDLANRLLAANLFCPPNGVTYTQMEAIFLAYLNKNPSTTHQLSGILFRQALFDAYPCMVELEPLLKAPK